MWWRCSRKVMQKELCQAWNKRTEKCVDTAYSTGSRVQLRARKVGYQWEKEKGLRLSDLRAFKGSLTLPDYIILEQSLPAELQFLLKILLARSQWEVTKLMCTECLGQRLCIKGTDSPQMSVFSPKWEENNGALGALLCNFLHRDQHCHCSS